MDDQLEIEYNNDMYFMDAFSQRIATDFLADDKANVISGAGKGFIIEYLNAAGNLVELTVENSSVYTTLNGQYITVDIDGSAAYNLFQMFKAIYFNEQEKRQAAYNASIEKVMHDYTGFVKND